jgi:drug/metabolite transporter (DMT)-like permease
MTEPRQSRDLTAEFILITVVTLWAANFPVAKWGISGFGALVFNSLRYLIASLTLAGLYFGRSRWKPLDKGDWKRILLVSIVSNIIYQMAFIIGLSLTSAGNSAVLLSTAPLWIVFISSLMHKEGIRPTVWLGMVVSLAGVVLIISGSGRTFELAGEGITGDLVTLAAAMLWGLSTNLQKPLLVRYSAIQLNLIMVGVGGVGLTLIALPDFFARDLVAVDNSYYVAALASGALSIGVANMLWSVGVKRLGPSRTGNFGNLVPVLAFLFAYLIFDEPVRLQQAIGAAVTLAGVMIARR